MKLANPDLIDALGSELKTFRERHLQFQTRITAANEAARTRDEEARKQNSRLTERIIELEKVLKITKESIEVSCSLFCSARLVQG